MCDNQIFFNGNHVVYVQVQNHFSNICINCRSRPRLFGSDYCSMHCGRVHTMHSSMQYGQAVLLGQAVQRGPSGCYRCGRILTTHIYSPYCSFNCRT